MISGGIFDCSAKLERVAELDHLSAQPGFWDDQATAQTLLKERNQIKDKLDGLDGIGELLDDAEVITVLVLLFEEVLPLFLFFFARKTCRLEKRNVFPEFDDDFKRF